MIAAPSRAGWIRNLPAIVTLSLLSACAATGRDGPPPIAVPVVDDPAPIVSGTMRPYQIRGRWYRPAEDPAYEAVGLASWYGAQFEGRPTASGERFAMNALTAAHKTLPLPGLVEVTNLANGRRAVLRLNDRGPFVDGRIIDLSRGAAEALGLLEAGVGEVRVRYLGRAPKIGGGAVSHGDPPPTRERSRETPTVWIQAGVFGDLVAAQLQAEGLGGQARAVPVGPGAEFGHRVLIGPWTDAEAAETARVDLLARGVAGAVLISTP